MMKIFLSAVTRQFKQCRDELASDLRAVGAEVVVQEEFQQYGGSLLVKLESYIASCDRVIALIGDAYGWEPEETARPKNRPRRSYSQWEVFFALGERLTNPQQPPKDLYLYFATPDFLAQNVVIQQADAEALQRDFVAELHRSGQDWNEFHSVDRLRALALRDGFSLAERSTPKLESLRAKAIEPARALITNAKTRWHYPETMVAVRMEASNTDSQPPEPTHPIMLPDVITHLRDIGSAFLLGEAGIGKTTMLLSICDALLDDPSSPLPIFIDAGTWASTNTALFDYITSFPAFSAVGLLPEDLSRLNEIGKLLVVLNGWNEIEIHAQTQSVNRLRQYLDGSLHPRVAIATRSAIGFVAMPDAITVTVRGFTWEEQQAFIRTSLPEDKANELITQLREDVRLRSVTKNPFTLSGVVALHRGGQSLPNNLFELFSAVIEEFETNPLHSSALMEPPIVGNHRLYLETLAQTMNTAGATVLSQADAQSAVVAVSRQLSATGIFGSQVPMPANVIAALCAHHLLHRAGRTEIRFAHQRFQEFFGACNVLSWLADAASNDEARNLLQTEILNWPFWEDSIYLVAEKLAIDAAQKDKAELLVALMTPIDLACACRLAGIMHLGADTGTVWDSLVASINQLYDHGEPEARQYALHCAVVTRSPIFASLMWPLIEDSDQQVRFTAYRIAGGITLDQLGSGAVDRIAGWSEDNRAEAVFEFAELSENFDFIRLCARNDPAPSVRASAIRALDYIGATETAVVEWRAAPDEVKGHEEALSVALDIWHSEDPELTAEILRIARNSKSDTVRHKVGLRLGSFAEELGVAVAKTILLGETTQRPAANTQIALLREHEPLFLKEQAEQLFKNKIGLPDWVIDEIKMWPAEERDRIAVEALDRLSSSDNEHCDARVATGASDALVTRLVVDGAALATEWGKQDDSLRLRLRAIERLLAHVQESALFSAVINHMPSCSYDAAAWLVEVLDHRAKDEETLSYDSEVDRWRPNPVDLDALILSVSGLREAQEIPTCKLEAHLAALSSKTDPNRYLWYVIEATKRHARAFYVYDIAIKQWCTEKYRSPRPTNPFYGNWLKEALRRCGFPAVPLLLDMAGEPGAHHIVPDALVAIVATPWEKKRERKIFFSGSHIKDHLIRKSSGRVFLQPDDALQPVTDEVAMYFVEQISTIIKNGDTADTIDLSQPSPHSNDFWAMCNCLARTPSREGEKILLSTLSRSDAKLYPYMGTAQAVIAQGGKLPKESLAAIKNIWAATTSATWIDENMQYQLSNLMTLHFFVDPIECGLEQFNSLLPEWLNKVRMWTVVDALVGVPTKEALEVLAGLLTNDQMNPDLEDRVIQTITASPLPESAEVLLQMIESGALEIYARSMFHVYRSAEPSFAREIRSNPKFRERVVTAMQARTDARAEALVCSLFGSLDNPEAIQLVYRYLNEEAYPKGGHHTADVLLRRFSFKKPGEQGADWYDILPKADNELRRNLFRFTIDNGTFHRRARSILLTLEDNRLEGDRPADEPRHPAIETGSPWPSCLFYSCDGQLY